VCILYRRRRFVVNSSSVSFALVSPLSVGFITKCEHNHQRDRRSSDCLFPCFVYFLCAAAGIAAATVTSVSILLIYVFPCSTRVHVCVLTADFRVTVLSCSCGVCRAAEHPARGEPQDRRGQH
jgi:hypothetical protein